MSFQPYDEPRPRNRVLADLKRAVTRARREGLSAQEVQAAVRDDLAAYPGPKVKDPRA